MWRLASANTLKMTFRNTYLQHILKLLRPERGLIKSHISNDVERSYIRGGSRDLLLTDLVLFLSYPYPCTGPDNDDDGKIHSDRRRTSDRNKQPAT